MCHGSVPAASACAKACKRIGCVGAQEARLMLSHEADVWPLPAAAHLCGDAGEFVSDSVAIGRGRGLSPGEKRFRAPRV